MTEPYKNEQTGSPMMDRIQREISRAIDAVRAIEARLAKPRAVSLAKDFTNTEARLKPTGLGFGGLRGETWLVELKFNAGCSGSANGMKFGVLAPAASVVSGALDSSLTNATDDAHVQLNAVNTATSAVHTVNGGSRDDEAYFVIKLGADGRVEWGMQPTTATNTATIAGRGWLRATLLEVANG